MAVNPDGRRMKIGTFARTGERNMDGNRVGFREIREWAVAAEAVGFDSFWLPDHFIFRPHEPEQLGCWETFTMLGALASATSAIALGPFVANTAFRNPALLAKMADTLDEITGGRFLLGLGAGNWEWEHAMFGYPFDRRAGRFEEAIQIIAPLLREGRADFHGKYSAVNDAVLSPRGPSPSGPPVWVGAKGARMLRIVAAHADGFIAIWPHTTEQVIEQWGQVVTACADVGRDPATLNLIVGTHVTLPESGEGETDDRAISGTYEEIAARLRAFADAGVRHLIVDFRPDISVRALEEFARVLALME
jgi:probable F420-dependent oxidoreductase